MKTCLFCGRTLDDLSRSQEHVVPQSMGGAGWLTTYQVCKPCNNTLGESVDDVSGTDLLKALRAEAGLTNARPIRGVMFDEETSLQLDGHLDTRSQTFVPRERTYLRGKERFIYARDEDAGRREAERQTERGIKRGDIYTWSESEPTGSDPTVIRVGPNPYQPVGDLLRREAAKIAVEYVALRGSADVARDPRLQALRGLALTGSDAQVEEGYLLDVSKGGVYLPRIDFPIWAGPPGTAPPSDEQLTARLTDSEGQRRNSAAGLPSLTRIFHQMTFRHRSERSAFHLTLFGLFHFGIPIPPDLPVEWNRYDYRDFSGGRMRTVTGFSG